MVERPSGTVTFLFTDAEGSTAHWERHPTAMQSALAIHDEILQSVIAELRGTTYASGGDAFAAVFDRADAAVRAAIESQRRLVTTNWPRGLPLKVRMGLHTGEAHERHNDYIGPAVNRAARVMDAANGSQILLSAATREVLGDGFAPTTTIIDLGVHELRDVVEPMRLYRLEDTAFERDPRPPRTGGVRVGNLPTATGMLLGRAADVEAIVEDLTTRALVTLTGVGGIGKTRMALEVGRALQRERRDGIWFAPLETIDRPDGMVRALLGVLSIAPRGANDLDSLIEGLRFRDCLLILDNCEHLLDAAAEVAAAVVSSCPNVQVLATSREPLDVEGEHTRRVRSLSTDDDGAAVELFRVRAEEAGAVVVDARDSDAIVRICRRLDGIPLAIELAAARTRSLRPAEIADRLDDMLRLLTGGRRARAERHRTLRATLEWSHEMLTEPERTVLAQLSAFAGSFSLQAAEAIASSGAVPTGGTVDVIDRLIARSLVVPLDEVGDESRYRLLEPVRQLAAEKLASRGETEAARKAHTAWYLDLLVGLGGRWRTGDDQGTWPVAARELPNLRAAFDHLIDMERIDDAQRFVVAGYGPISCHFDTVLLYDWAPRAAGLDLDHVGPDTASVRALAAWGAIPRADLDGAAEWIRLGVDALEAGSRDDGFVAAAAIHHVGSGGDLAVSTVFLRRSLDDALRSDDLHRQVWVLTYSRRRDEAIRAAQRLGNRLLIALAHAVEVASSDPESVWESAELFWDTAQRSHSFLMMNGAALRLGAEHIRAGAPVDGLLLLRAPARDWLLRGDARVWDVLHAIATGLAAAGDAIAAARLLGAVGDRRLSTLIRGADPKHLRSLINGRLSQAEVARHLTAGRELDAGGAVAEAFDRIETLTAADTDGGGEAADGTATLTTRQLEVAGLVARGLTNKQIAHRLGISRLTAETHVRNILERLGAASRSEIAVWASQRAGH